MAYTTIDDPTIFFNTIIYTGDGTSKTITGVGFQPDWVWGKGRNSNSAHLLTDSVRGATKTLYSNATSAEVTSSTASLTGFTSDGYTVDSASNYNVNSRTQVNWNWLAGGSAPAITYTVKVVSDSGNKYRFDDFGTSAVTLDLQEGGTYTFDQSDSSNSGHPLRFSTTSNGTHGGGSEYTTGVTTTGTPGYAGAKTVITVAASAPTLYYYCTNHSLMGGQANTNSTFGSSNFSGSIQSTVSAGITQGMSIVSYTGTGANATVGHGLGSVPKMIIIKNRDDTDSWRVYHASTGNGGSLMLNLTNAFASDSTMWNNTSPTSSEFSLGDHDNVNGNSHKFIAYCFAEKKGYSKFGSYVGNGSSSGSMIVTGFKPAWVMIKRTDTANDWNIQDSKRTDYNGKQTTSLQANTNSSESTIGTDFRRDILSNGFKIRNDGAETNASGGTYIYMAFAESPFVNSSGVPNNAR